MKKSICYLLAGILGFGFSARMSAEQISEADALRIANEFRSGDRHLKKSSGVQLKLAYKSPASVGEAFYVFNSSNGNGYTIVSGNDLVPGVLGYSDSGSFNPENMPENMKVWLNGYVRLINHAIEKEIYLDQQIQDDYRPDVEPIMATKWDQGEPYYNLCPMIRNQHTYTGCVATAMAQVMKVFDWPEQAKGTCEFGGKTVTLNSIYEWDRMLNEYNAGSYTPAQGNAVAQLMFDCGRSVDMEYGTQASGALSDAMQRALINNFSYDQGVCYSLRKYYEDDEWLELMYQEVAAGRPILYGGSSNAGGHQFVADGYRTGGFFHINWGWSGTSDGYFLLGSLDPEHQGTGGSGDGSGFEWDQDAVYSVQKPCGGKLQTEIVAAGNFALGESQGSVDVFTTTKSSLISNSGQRVNGFVNFTGLDFKVYPGVRLTNMDNGEEINLQYEDIQQFNSWTTVVSSYPVEMSTVKDGKYVVYPYSYALDGTAHLTRATVEPERSNFLILEVKNARRTYSFPDEVPDFKKVALGITIVPEAESISKEEKTILNVNVVPAYASYQRILWSSSDESVATVNNGVVTGVSKGTATITATTTDGSGLAASCLIMVEGGDDVGIEAIAEDGVYTVYDVLGTLLVKDGSYKDVKALPRGVYIVNGQKILL